MLRAATGVSMVQFFYCKVPLRAFHKHMETHRLCPVTVVMLRFVWS
jgi:hypothetical protein